MKGKTDVPMAILTAESLLAGKRIRARIVFYGMFGWALRLAERLTALFLAWAFLAGLSVWLETAFGLRPWPSLLLRLAGLLPLAVLAFLWLRGFFRERPTLDTLSRELENRIPGLSNRLVTAVEFEREAARPEGGHLRYFSPLLVNAFFLESRRTARRRAWMRIALRPALACGLAGLAVLCLAAAWLPHYSPFEWRSVLNVYFAPLHRNPFFDPARIVVEPGDTQVTVGDDLEVRARMAGGNARSMDIVFRTGETGADQTRMVSEEDGAFTHRFRNLQESMRYRVAGGGKESPEFEIRVVKRIRLTNLSILLTYPSYTGMGLGIGDREEGSIAAPIGTRCQLAAEFDEPADGAVLHLRQSEEDGSERDISMKDTGVDWEAEFTLLGSGSYSISATWNGGSPGESPVYTLQAIRDATPTVELLVPDGDVDLSRQDRYPPWLSFSEGGPALAIRYRAADDLGLREAHLIIEDWGGNLLERLPLRTFTGPARTASETYPWALRDWWGGPDVQVSIEVKDSLAARPDLAKEFYGAEEIAGHTVASRKVRVIWREGDRVARQEPEEPKKQSEGEEERQSGDEGKAGREGEKQGTEQGEGAKPGPGERALQLAREVAEIRKQQENINRETGEKTGDGSRPQDGSEPQDEGAPDAVTGGRSRGGGSAADARQLAGRQRGLAGRVAEAEAKMREAASEARSAARQGPGDSPEGGRQGESGEGGGGERLAAAAQDLEEAADRLSRKSVWDGNHLQSGVGSQMDRNVSALEKREWERARSGGERIAGELEEVERMLEQIARAGDRDEGRGPQDEPDSEPGRPAETGGKERPVAGGEAAESPAPQTAGEEARTAEVAPGGEGSAGGPGSAEGPTEMPGQPSSISAGPMRADGLVNMRFRLPDDAMTDLGRGEGAESAAPPGQLDFGKGTAYSLDKIPARYRDEVNRYYELLGSP